MASTLREEIQKTVDFINTRLVRHGAAMLIQGLLLVGIRREKDGGYRVVTVQQFANDHQLAIAAAQLAICASMDREPPHPDTTLFPTGEFDWFPEEDEQPSKPPSQRPS